MSEIAPNTAQNIIQEKVFVQEIPMRTQEKPVRNSKLVPMLTRVFIILLIVVSFLIGAYVRDYTEQSRLAKLNENVSNAAAQLQKLKSQLLEKEQELIALSLAQQQDEGKKQQVIDQVKLITDQINELEGKDNTNIQYPLSVPVSGIVVTSAGTFGGTLYGKAHLGVDIWATKVNSGKLESHKGNPVYSACAGKVVTVGAPNGSVTVLCDQIPDTYNVPQKKVYTYYGHMGNGVTKELFIMVEKGQRVDTNTQLGFQGDLSSFYPNMRNVHLHFSVFTGKSETDPAGGAIDPCLYIGGKCTEPGQIYTRS